MDNLIKIGDISLGKGQPLALIAGPCVIETPEITIEIASYLKTLTRKLGIPFIFKASYDKANRTSLSSFRGPGITEGLKILDHIRKTLNIPVLSDVHQIHEIEAAARVLDVIQIPAFLCRQTDFVLAVAKTGKPVNIKKGQFLAPRDMTNVAEKAKSVGNHQIFLTERGAMFGYNNLVADFRSIRIMQDTVECPVIFDATHSVQLPGGAGASSGGQREFAPILARAAVAAGADGVFMEVHTDPDRALCDGPNSLKLGTFEELLVQLRAIKNILSENKMSGNIPQASSPGEGIQADIGNPVSVFARGTAGYDNRLRQVKLLLLDVDGVMTDGSIVYSDSGAEIKSFHVKDGAGIRLLGEAGIKVGIVTGRRSDALRHRCENLGMDLIFDGIRDKAAILDNISEQTGISPDNMAFMGDDLVDISLMRRVGLSIVVADAHETVTEVADMITEARGGAGAVREICDAILKAQGLWEKAMKVFL